MAAQLAVEQNTIEQRQVAVRFGKDLAPGRSGRQAAEKVLRCGSRSRLP